MSLARGMDISIYQPNIDWPLVIQATGISFVIIRVGDGSFADPIFVKHWAEAKQAGLLRGAYFFLRQNVDADQQAQMFLDALGGDPGELPPVLDIEDTRVTSAAAYGAAAQSWLHTVQAQLQRQPILYTGAWWWNPNMLMGGRYPDWAPSYKLWVASYPLRSGVPTPAQVEGGQFTPIMPKSWTAWLMWQYSGDVATVDGVTDANGNAPHVDLDVFNGTLDDLKAIAQPAPAATNPGNSGDSGGATTPSTGPASTTTTSTTTTTPPVDTPPAGLPLPDARVTNQVMINAFSKAFGGVYWQVVLRCGLSSLAVDRQAVYAGPAIQSLAALAADEQAALEAKLELVVSG